MGVIQGFLPVSIFFLILHQICGRLEAGGFSRQPVSSFVNCRANGAGLAGSNLRGRSVGMNQGFYRWSVPLLRTLVVACFFIGYGLASLLGEVPYRKPRIRTVTAFVRIEPSEPHSQIERAVSMLREAKTAFEKGGYVVQTTRITTQPFVQYAGDRSAMEALDLFRSMDEWSRKDSFLLNIGPLTPTDLRDGTKLELLSQALATTKVNASLVVAGEGGVQWTAVRAAARVIKYLEDHSPNGANNFDFAAVAMVPPNTPFFPASNHDSAGHEFSIGWEAGAFVSDVVAGANGDMQVARERLASEFERQARAVDAIARQVEKESAWKYMGLDPTPAPLTDSSIGTAIETLSRAKFGSMGTLSAAAVITEAEHSISVQRVGFSGLMLPVLEDPVLAERWSEGTFDLDSLLAYSAVCGTGLDTIPLPGDVSQQQLERIIGDMASLAFKWHKPLTARLIPAPGKKAGERTNFNFGVGFPNTILQGLR
jgi:uncharacterized protein